MVEAPKKRKWWMVVPRLAMGLLLPLSIPVETFGAEDIEKSAKVLQIVRETTNEICTNVDINGKSSGYDVSGEINVAVAGVLEKVRELDVHGTGNLHSEEYKNVLQKDLAAVIERNIDCRQGVFNVLANKLLPTPSLEESPLAISLKVMGVNFVGSAFLVDSSFEKTGAAPLHECIFNIWPSREALNDPFTIPSGPFEQTMSFYIPGGDNPLTHPGVSVLLSCDKATSPLVSVGGFGPAYWRWHDRFN
jgi:hypothetical protein